MKLIIFLFSLNLYAEPIKLYTEPLNECGQTKKEWFNEDTFCLERRGDDTFESRFDDSVPNSELFSIQTDEEFNNTWELAE